MNLFSQAPYRFMLYVIQNVIEHNNNINKFKFTIMKLLYRSN